MAGAALIMPAVAKGQATAPPVLQANPAFSRPRPIPTAPTSNMATSPNATVGMTPMPASPGPGTTSQVVKPHGRRSTAAPAAEAAPATPPPPQTLEQMPAVAPQVTLQNGELTINASNSTMAQVLHAVQARTGASIDIPASANSERVVAQIGPGLPREVLNTLLNGSRFNYVILGVSGDPGGIQKVILTPRQGGSAPAVNTAQNNSPQPAQEDDQVDENIPVADTAENEYQNPDQPPPPPGGFRRPMMPGGPQIDPGAQAGGGEQQNGPKTPEQLMQEMQQLQQQQMMYNEQLNPANQQPN